MEEEIRKRITYALEMHDRAMRSDNIEAAYTLSGIITNLTCAYTHLLEASDNTEGEDWKPR